MKTIVRFGEGKLFYDDILKKIGEFGFYQKYIFAILSYQPFTSGLLLLLSTFTLFTPNHRCMLPGLDNDTYLSQGIYHDYLINQSIPQDSKCFLRNQTTDEHGNETSHEYKCHAWVYEDSTFTSTFVTKFNLVCDDAVLKSNAVMMVFLGLLIGYGCISNLADFFGRKPVMVAGNYTTVICCYLLIWTPNYTFLLVFRFFLGLGVAAQALTVYNTGMEMVGPSYRRITGVFTNFTWCFGVTVMALMGYLLRTWISLHIGIAVLCSFLLFFVVLIPESPRWLLTRGHHNRAKVIILKVARGNDVEVEGDFLIELKTDNKENLRPIRFWKMFTTPVLLFRTLTVYFTWFTASIMYFGIMLNLDSLVGDIFLNMFLAILLEGLAYTLVITTVDKVGRLRLTLICLVLTIVCMVSVICIILFAASDIHWLMTFITLIGQFGINSVFTVIWLWTGELFPTELRNFGVGTSSAVARLASLAAPYLSLENSLVFDGINISPFIIYSSFCLVALVLVFCLMPETAKQILPETIEDCKNLGKRRVKKSRKQTPSEQQDNHVSTTKNWEKAS